MSIPFGPRLIGETEKTLNALLRHFLADTGLTEPEWVTLQIAGELGGSSDAAHLSAEATDRAHFENSAQIVASLTDRGLLADGQLTESGHSLISRVRTRVTTEAGPIWRDLPAEDVATTGRTLNEVVTRASVVLANLDSQAIAPAISNRKDNPAWMVREIRAALHKRAA